MATVLGYFYIYVEWYKAKLQIIIDIAMKKREIFAEILRIVEEETEVSAENILSGLRQTEIVDARYLLIKTLRDYGFYPREIARMMGITARAIHYILTNFDTRMDYAKYKRNSYEIIRNRARNICL